MKKLLSILMIVAFISSCQKQVIKPENNVLSLQVAVSPLTQSTIDTLSVKWRLVETTDWLNNTRCLNYMYGYGNSQNLFLQFCDIIKFNSNSGKLDINQYTYNAPFSWTYTVGLNFYSNVEQSGPNITQDCNIHGDTICLPPINCWNTTRGNANNTNYTIPTTLIWNNNDPTGIGTKSIIMTDTTYPAGFIRVMSFIRA